MAAFSSYFLGLKKPATSSSAPLAPAPGASSASTVLGSTAKVAAVPTSSTVLGTPTAAPATTPKKIKLGAPKPATTGVY